MLPGDEGSGQAAPAVLPPAVLPPAVSRDTPAAGLLQGVTPWRDVADHGRAAPAIAVVEERRSEGLHWSQLGALRPRPVIEPRLAGARIPTAMRLLATLTALVLHVAIVMAVRALALPPPLGGATEIPFEYLTERTAAALPPDVAITAEVPPLRAEVVAMAAGAPAIQAAPEASPLMAPDLPSLPVAASPAQPDPPDSSMAALRSEPPPSARALTDVLPVPVLEPAVPLLPSPEPMPLPASGPEPPEVSATREASGVTADSVPSSALAPSVEPLVPSPPSPPLGTKQPAGPPSRIATPTATDIRAAKIRDARALATQAADEARAKLTAEAKALARREAQAMARAARSAAPRAMSPQRPEPAGEASAVDAAAYGRAVVGRIAAMKHYPDAARDRGARGTAIVSFTIGPSGDASGIAIARSSGDPVLDSEAVATVRRSSPFPAPPSGGSHRFSAPLAFDIR